MAAYRIEVKRYGSWNVRAEGELSSTITREALIAALPRYCINYPHRLIIDDELVAHDRPKAIVGDWSEID